MKRIQIGACCGVLLLACMGVAGATAQQNALLTETNIVLDGTAVQPQGYNIQGYNYYKLRDVAYLLTDTQSKFSVGWDDTLRTVSIILSEPYVATGDEMQKTTIAETTAVASTAQIVCDGKIISPETYNINGNTYFKLRDLGDALDFAVGYDYDTREVLINTPPPVEIPSLGDQGTDKDETDKGETDKGETDKGETDKDETDKDKVEDDIKPEEPQFFGRIDGELVILIDPGHGGSDGGASIAASNSFYMPDGTYISSGTTIREKDFTLIVSLYLQELLEAEGATVRMTRTTDVTVDSTARSQIIRQEAVTSDLVFSVHHNSASSQTATGAEVLAQIAYKNGGAGAEFAALLDDAYRSLGQSIRSTVYRTYPQKEHLDYYFVLRAAQEVDALAVISEFCFMSNPTDQQWLHSEAKLRAQAQAAHDAIMAYFETNPY